MSIVGGGSPNLAGLLANPEALQAEIERLNAAAERAERATTIAHTVEQAETLLADAQAQHVDAMHTVTKANRDADGIIARATAKAYDLKNEAEKKHADLMAAAAKIKTEADQRLEQARSVERSLAEREASLTDLRRELEGARDRAEQMAKGFDQAKKDQIVEKLRLQAAKKALLEVLGETGKG